MTKPTLAARAMLAASLYLLAAPAAAQQAAPANTVPPAAPEEEPSTTVGPESLRDFSLGGEEAPAQETPPAATPAEPVETPAAPVATPPAPRPQPQQVQPQPQPQPVPVPIEPTVQPPVEEAPAEVTPPSADLPGEAADVAIAPRGMAPEDYAEESSLPGWLLALVPVLVTIGAFVLIARRRKSRPAPAAATPAPVMPREAAPEPAPAPEPEPEPEPAPAPAPTTINSGITTTLKPDLHVAVTPVRCALDEEELWIDYRVDIANRGSAAAHNVRFDVAMLNAGPDQKQHLEEFLAYPPAPANAPVPVLHPGQMQSLGGRAALPLSQAKAYMIEERPLLAPILALALRRTAGANGAPVKPEKAHAYMVGRTGASEGKLAPIRADVRPKLIRDVALKPL